MNSRLLNYMLFVLFLSFPLIVVIASNTRLSENKGQWFTHELIAEKVWCIKDNGIVNIYLIEGNEKALLIDTGIGAGDLKDYIKTITNLPVIVVNTHGHPDHAGGNFQFTEIYAHSTDFEMVNHYNSKEYHELNINNTIKENPGLEQYIIKDIEEFKISSMKPVNDGHVFNLGGRKLEVIETPGHTPGSIVLLDTKNKLLFAGDNNNPLVWLFLEECLPLERYLQELVKLNERSDEFNAVLPGHGPAVNKTIINDQIACAKSIINGECKGEEYTSFAGSGLICSFNNSKIVYNPENICERK